MSILSVVAVVVIVGYVIGRQLLGEPVRGKRLIVLPLILAIVGAVDLGKTGSHPGPADIALIVVEAVIAALIGLGQGALMRLEARDGALWGQMPGRSLWLWIALVASHGGLDLVAVGVGAHVAAGTSPILLVLGINRLAQAVVIGTRALGAGVPFAAEKDGSAFLAGLFRSGPTHSGANRVPSGREGPSRLQPGRPVRVTPGQDPLDGDGVVGAVGMQTVLRMIADWLEGRRRRR